MFRMWSRIYKENHLIKDTVIEDSSVDTRTHKVFRALSASAEALDISTPIWLDKNIKEFGRFSHTRFTSDNFIEQPDFDYLEIRILEED